MQTSENVSCLVYCTVTFKFTPLLLGKVTVCDTMINKYGTDPYKADPDPHEADPDPHQDDSDPHQDDPVPHHDNPVPYQMILICIMIILFRIK